MYQQKSSDVVARGHVHVMQMAVDARRLLGEWKVSVYEADTHWCCLHAPQEQEDKIVLAAAAQVWEDTAWALSKKMWGGDSNRSNDCALKKRKKNFIRTCVLGVRACYSRHYQSFIALPILYRTEACPIEQPIFLSSLCCELPRSQTPTLWGIKKRRLLLIITLLQYKRRLW